MTVYFKIYSRKSYEKSLFQTCKTLGNMKFYSKFKIASDTVSGRQNAIFVAGLLYQAANSFFSIKKVSGYLDQPSNSCFETWMSKSFLSSSKIQNSMGKDELPCLPSPPMCTIVLSLNNFKMDWSSMGKLFSELLLSRSVIF